MVCKTEKAFPTRRALNSHLTNWYRSRLQQYTGHDGNPIYTLEPLSEYDYQVRRHRIRLSAASRSERVIIRRRTQTTIRPPKLDHIQVEGGREAVMNISAALRSPTTPKSLQLPAETDNVPNDNNSTVADEDWFDMDNATTQSLIDIIPCETNSSDQQNEIYRAPTPMEQLTIGNAPREGVEEEEADDLIIPQPIEFSDITDNDNFFDRSIF